MSEQTIKPDVNCCYTRDGVPLDIPIPNKDTTEVKRLDGHDITVMKRNGYISGANVCASIRKERGLKTLYYPGWSSTSYVRRFVTCLEQECDINAEIVYKKDGGYKSTYVHPAIYLFMMMWFSAEFYVKVVLYYLKNNPDAENIASSHMKLPPKQKDLPREDIDSGLYLIELGTKEQLKHLYNLKKYPNNCKLYKYGKSDEISRRFKRHCTNDYKREYGYTPKLVYKVAVPEDLQIAAETELGLMFESFKIRVKHKKHIEIIAATNEQLVGVKKLMDAQCYHYSRV